MATRFRRHKNRKQRYCNTCTAVQKQLTRCNDQRPQNATAEKNSICSFGDVRGSDVTEKAHTQPQHSRCLHYPVSLTRHTYYYAPRRCTASCTISSRSARENAKLLYSCKVRAVGQRETKRPPTVCTSRTCQASSLPAGVRSPRGPALTVPLSI